MSKATEYLQNLMIMITDQGNVALSKGIQYTGLTSIGVGGGLSVAQSGKSIQSEAMMTLADWGIVISIIGGATFIIKNIADIYFSYRRAKREQNERNNNG